MSAILLRVLIVAAVIAGAGVLGWWWRRRDGHLRTAGGADGFGRDELASLGLDPAGAEALAVLLGTPSCVSCVGVRRLLDELAGERAGLRWADVDATERLDLVERHRVLRAPTLFLLDPEGRVLARTSGVPTRADLLRVLDHDGEVHPAA